MSDPTDTPVTVFAADPTPMGLLGLCETIRQTVHLRLAGHAADGHHALAAIRAEPPDVAVLDAYLDGRDGCEITRILRADQLPTRTLIIAERHTGDLVLEALTGGAAGFVGKRASPEAVVDAIRTVARGESVLPSDVGSAVAELLTRRGEGEHPQLSPRELQVLALIARGEHAPGIAQQLQISIPTVKTHIQNAYIKLGVNDRGAAVATAMRRGLLP